MTQNKITTLRLDEIIVDHEFNCRDALVPSDVRELAKQIDRMGLIQPITVRRLDDGSLRLVAGFRRYAAVKMLKKDTIDAIIRDDLSEIDAAAINLAENIERKNLTPLEEARSLNKLLNQGYGAEEIGSKLNRSATWVDSRLSILRLPPLVQEEVANGSINLKQVRFLCDLPEQVQYAQIKAIKERRARLDTERAFKFAQNERKKISRASKGKPRQAKELALVRNYVYTLFGGDTIDVAYLSWAEGLIPFGRLEEYIKEQANLFGVDYKPLEEA